MNYTLINFYRPTHCDSNTNSLHPSVLTGYDVNKVLNCFTLEVIEIITTKHSECFGKLVLNVNLIPPNLSQSEKCS